MIESNARREILEKQAFNSLTRSIISLGAPKPTSTKTERDAHQAEMKCKAIDRYHCAGGNPNVTKCMILGCNFSTNEVVAGHIIGIDQKSSLEILNLTAGDVWNPKNCVLWHNAIEAKYSSMEIVRFLFHLFYKIDYAKVCLCYNRRCCIVLIATW